MNVLRSFRRRKGSKKSGPVITDIVTTSGRVEMHSARSAKATTPREKRAIMREKLKMQQEEEQNNKLLANQSITASRKAAFAVYEGSEEDEDEDDKVVSTGALRRSARLLKKSGKKGQLGENELLEKENETDTDAADENKVNQGESGGRNKHSKQSTTSETFHSRKSKMKEKLNELISKCGNLKAEYEQGMKVLLPEINELLSIFQTFASDTEDYILIESAKRISSYEIQPSQHQEFENVSPLKSPYPKNSSTTPAPASSTKRSGGFSKSPESLTLNITSDMKRISPTSGISSATKTPASFSRRLTKSDQPARSAQSFNSFGRSKNLSPIGITFSESDEDKIEIKSRKAESSMAAVPVSAAKMKVKRDHKKKQLPPIPKEKHRRADTPHPSASNLKPKTKGPISGISAESSPEKPHKNHIDTPHPNLKERQRRLTGTTRRSKTRGAKMLAAAAAQTSHSQPQEMFMTPQVRSLNFGKHEKDRTNKNNLVGGSNPDALKHKKVHFGY